MKNKNMIGKTYNQLTVIKMMEDKINGQIACKCLCSCGNETTVRATNVRTGVTKSCGCLVGKHVRTGRPTTLAVGEGSRNSCYALYKSGAKRRNLEFTLTVQQFEQLTQQNCIYCNATPSNIYKSQRERGDFVYNGIDRVDNSEGYIPNNCVPCCTRCNMMKGTLSVNDFIENISTIFNNYKTGT